jgi:hypothetical protein
VADVMKEQLGLVPDMTSCCQQHICWYWLHSLPPDVKAHCLCPADVFKEHLGLVLEREDEIGCCQRLVCWHWCTNP